MLIRYNRKHIHHMPKTYFPMKPNISSMDVGNINVEKEMKTEPEMVVPKKPKPKTNKKDIAETTTENGSKNTITDNNTLEQ